jgi:hypothetical protein
MTDAWFTVFTSDDLAVVERYLYDHTTIAKSDTLVQYGKTYTVALCKTTADTQERTDYLANYQTERLASGLHRTSPVRATSDEALDDLAAHSGVRL